MARAGRKSARCCSATAGHGGCLARWASPWGQTVCPLPPQWVCAGAYCLVGDGGDGGTRWGRGRESNICRGIDGERKSFLMSSHIDSKVDFVEDQFLTASLFCDCQNNLISQAIGNIIHDCSSSREQARRAFYWVRDSIKY